MDFLVRRDDIRECRFDDLPAAGASAGQALLEVERFGLTSNNVTYAVHGRRHVLLALLPGARRAGGAFPVWGFARVAASPATTTCSEGARVYGYLPPSTPPAA